MTEIAKQCTACGCENKGRGQWWYLSGYFLAPNGYYCPSCYDAVAHDSYDNPTNMKRHEAFLKKQNKERSK